MPPKKSSPLPWILGGIGLVLIVGTAMVGGFVFPGWFVHKTVHVAAPPQKGFASELSDDVAQQFIATANRHDPTALNQIICDDAEGSASAFIDKIVADQATVVNVSTDSNGGLVTFWTHINVTDQGQTGPYTLTWKTNDDNSTNAHTCLEKVEKGTS